MRKYEDQLYNRLQELLNKEARGGKEVLVVRDLIRKERGNDPPACFGTDDCSTQALCVCPWRFDCGDLTVENE